MLCRKSFMNPAMRSKISCSLVFLISLYVVQIQGNPFDDTSNQESEIAEDTSRVKREVQGAETFVEGKFVPYPDHSDTDLCQNATVDALVILKDGTTYAFKGAYFWKVINDKIEEGYPKLIHEHWQSLPDHIDAAFSYKNDQIIFLKGSKYWKFTGTKCDAGYPKLISEGFPGIPDNVQAATACGKSGYIYFFKGSYFWRYEPECKQPVTKAYPKLIAEVFDGIPDDLDDALWHTNGELYFLKGIRYWKFNVEKLKVDVVPMGLYSYPLLSSSMWFGCKPEP